MLCFDVSPLLKDDAEVLVGRVALILVIKTKRIQLSQDSRYNVRTNIKLTTSYEISLIIILAIVDTDWFVGVQLSRNAQNCIDRQLRCAERKQTARNYSAAGRHAAAPLSTPDTHDARTLFAYFCAVPRS